MGKAEAEGAGRRVLRYEGAAPATNLSEGKAVVLGGGEARLVASGLTPKWLLATVCVDCRTRHTQSLWSGVETSVWRTVKNRHPL